MYNTPCTGHANETTRARYAYNIINYYYYYAATAAQLLLYASYSF